MHSGQQLALNVQLSDEATFDNFFVAGDASNNLFSNKLVVQALQTFITFESTDQFIYLWGPRGCGLSHLLQAACHEAARTHRTSQYLPLADLVDYSPAELLDGLEQLDLLCMDELQQVLSKPAWDEALFHLYNRARERGCRLLVTANCAPRELQSSLPDLTSRLAWGTVYRVEPLSDEEKQQALQMRARFRGLELSDEAARFLLHHHGRETKALFDTLAILDRRSLAEKRKLSIPFIKEALGF